MKSLSFEYSQPFTKDQSECMVRMCFIEEEEELESMREDIIAIISKRINALDLPVRFSAKALVYTTVLCRGNPGRAVVTLIDVLDAGLTEVTMKDLVEMYPWGHYSDERFEVVINEHKKRHHKWSHIY